MPEVDLLYDGHSLVTMKVDIHGNEVTHTFLVDTGFIAQTGYGLKLPLQLLTLAKVRGTGTVTTGDDREVTGSIIPDVKVLEVEGNKLPSPIFIPTILIGTASYVVGVIFLQKCICHFDGPSRRLKMCF